MSTIDFFTKSNGVYVISVPPFQCHHFGATNSVPTNSVQRQLGADHFGAGQLGADHFGATKIYTNASVPENNIILNIKMCYHLGF